MQKLTHTTVLFDLDGTILDTLGDTAASVNHACRAVGMPGRTDDEVAAHMGRGIRNLVVNSLPAGTDEATIDRALAAYHEYYNEHYLDCSKPYDGVIDMLRNLKESGAKIGIISNKIEEYTLRISAELYDDFIDIAIGELPGVPLKPDPAPVNKALQLLNSSPAETVYVGDTDVDLATARNSNLACISCSWGMRTREFLLENGADPAKLADTPADVFRILSAE